MGAKGIMEKARIKRYCEHCRSETVHEAEEDVLEIEYRCTICNKHQEIIKTFF